MRIWSKSELKQLLMEQTAYEPHGKASLKLRAAFKDEPLWKFSCSSRHARGRISISTNNIELRHSVLHSLDRIGAAELSITYIPTKETRKTNQDDWKDWLTSMVESPDLSHPIYLVPDTNFIMRRYASRLFQKMGEETFRSLNFLIPNLAILEIEALYNRANKAIEKCRESNRQTKLIKRGEALIATKELIFLREKGAAMLSSGIGTREADSFSRISGRGVTDMFLRKEIRDSSAVSGRRNIRFLTCDLMNALAATAEGMISYYFSRLDSTIGVLSSETEPCLEQLSELIVDNATVFGEITLVESLSSVKPKTMRFNGTWDGWELSDLLEERIAEIE